MDKKTLQVLLDLAGVGSAEFPWLRRSVTGFRHTEEECDKAYRRAALEWKLMPEDDRRPTWDDVYMAFADTIGRKSRCTRDKVGCVIVTADNRVAAACYNGPPPRATETGAIPDAGMCIKWCKRAQAAARGDVLDHFYADCPSNHAESNAIARANWTDIAGGTAYVTSTLCIACAKNIASAGLGRVVFKVDPLRPRDVDTVVEFMRQLGGLEVTVIR
jgi:dCMP deaminase